MMLNIRFTRFEDLLEEFCNQLQEGMSNIRFTSTKDLLEECLNQRQERYDVNLRDGFSSSSTDCRGKATKVKEPTFGARVAYTSESEIKAVITTLPHDAYIRGSASSNC